MRNLYTPSQITLHWLIAGLVAFQFLFGEAIGPWFEYLTEGEGSPVRSAGATAHIVVGVAILTLMALRTALRLTQGAPAPIPQSPGWDRVATLWAHRLLYALLWAVPLLGLGAWLTVSEELGEAHAVLQNVLMIVVFVHIAGALFHQFVLRDRLIRRMMVPGAGGPRE